MPGLLQIAPDVTISYGSNVLTTHAEDSRQFSRREFGSSYEKHGFFCQSRTFSPAHIRRWCYWFKMIWSDARWLSAQMVDLKSLWNLSHFLLIHRAVRHVVLSLQANTAVARWPNRVGVPDVTRSLVVSILQMPLIVANSIAHCQIANVPTNESHMLSLNMADSLIGHGCPRGGSAAPALTDPRGIGERQFRSPSSRPMAAKVLLLIAFLVNARRARIWDGFLSATTRTEHRQDYNIGVPCQA